jgi:hypothetical protein
MAEAETANKATIRSAGRFRRTHGQSPRVLKVGAAESTP